MRKHIHPTINWRALPFIRLTLPLMLGIFLSEQFTCAPAWMNTCFFISFILFFLSLIRTNGFNQKWTTGIPITIFFVLLGHQMAYYQDDTRKATHFHQSITKENHLLGVVKEVFSTTNGKLKVSLKSQAIGSSKNSLSTCTGNLLVYLKRKESGPEVKIGDQLLLKSQLSLIPNTKNPHAFDYNRYLYFKNIHYQTFVNAENWIIISHNQGSHFYQRISETRRHYLCVLEKHIPTDNELAIASALILGYKDKLNQELRDAYAESGAIHVLAVSGLHVGIVSEFLLFLLVLLPFKGQWWSWCKLTVLLLTIWTFAMLTGLSSSVQRATIMFSALNIGLVFQRDVNTYNTMAIAAFFILIIDPYTLFDIGFQFSFLAVFGILFFVKRIRQIWIPNNKYLDKLWTMTLVSISAQLAVFPLILYYFHEIPVYFWLTGFFVIPLAGLLMKGGMLLLVASHLSDTLAGGVGQLLTQMIYFQNNAIDSIRSLPFHLLSSIWITQFEVVLFYGVVAGLALLLFTYNRRWAILSIGSLLLLSFTQIQKIYQTNQQRQIIIYAVQKKGVIDFVDGATIYTLETEELSEKEKIFTTQSNRSAIRAKNVISVNQPEMRTSNLLKRGNFIQFGNQRLVLIDRGNSIVNHSDKKFRTNYLLLQNNPKIDVEQIIRNYDFDQLIFDGSNTSWNIKKWKASCDEIGLAYYDVQQSGAYVADLKNDNIRPKSSPHKRTSELRSDY
ncbi:MAG: ComEC/Rec2 family competence protein [Bacteroidota bacterium]